MKQLTKACLRILDELEQTVERITKEDFSRPSEALNGATLGQHVRHTIEFFQCLQKGLHAGCVNYDNRVRDWQIENDRSVALRAIGSLREFVDKNTEDRPLSLEICFELRGEDKLIIGTTFYRELAYNIEHAIHHMAIIRPGMSEVVTLPENYGTAASTVRYRERKSA